MTHPTNILFAWPFLVDIGETRGGAASHFLYTTTDYGVLIAKLSQRVTEVTVTLIWVMYMNGTSEIVEQKRLNDLLARKDIAEFYRPSELRWVTLGLDRMRGEGGSYAGPERRCGWSQDREPRSPRSSSNVDG